MYFFVALLYNGLIREVEVMNNYFADNIRYLRKVHKLTQRQMGLKLGKSSTAIAGWEQGVRTPIVKDTMEICKAFNIDFNDLIYTDLSMHPEVVDNHLNEMIDLYKRLSADQQTAIINTMKAMVK